MTFQEKYAKDREEAQKALQEKLNQVDLEAFADTITEAICNKFDQDVSTAYNVERIKKSDQTYLESMFFVNVEFDSSIVTVGGKAIESCFGSYILKSEIAEIARKKLHDLGIDFKRDDRNFDKFSAQLVFDSNDNNSDS